MQDVFSVSFIRGFCDELLLVAEQIQDEELTMLVSRFQVRRKIMDERIKEVEELVYERLRKHGRLV